MDLSEVEVTNDGKGKWQSCRATLRGHDATGGKGSRAFDVEAHGATEGEALANLQAELDTLRRELAEVKIA